MKTKLFRHAAIEINFNGYNFLIDPMLSREGSMSAVVNSPQPRPNPLVPMPIMPVMENIDAVVLTHIHRDHFDDEAIKLIPKEMPVFCQSGDKEKIEEYGFKNVKPIQDQEIWKGITLIRTGGHHGTGEIGEKMGKVSGFVFKAPGEQTLYILGDTIWCSEVESALLEHQPEVSIVFAGAAQFLEGDPITMTKEDVQKVCKTNADMKVVAVHMEAFNHCLLTRAQLKKFAEATGFSGQLLIPRDGEEIIFP